MNKPYEMQKHVLALKSKIAERGKQLKEANSDAEKIEYAKLQDEITALAELYRYYCELYADEYRVISKTDTSRLDDVAQIEKMLSIAKSQMESGEIDRSHFMKVAKLAKQNLVMVCKVGKIGEYVSLLLEEKPKEQEER